MIFGSIAAEKMCNQTTYFFSYNIQFVYEYYRTKKQERLCMFAMLLASRRDNT